MQKMQNITVNEDTDIKKAIELFSRNSKFFIFSFTIAMLVAFLINRFVIPEYKISASLMIKEESRTTPGDNVDDYINNNLFVVNKNFQNELWIMKSSPVIEQTIRNLDLMVSYYLNTGIQYHDAYNNIPFKVLIIQDHVQPVDVRFEMSMQDEYNYQIRAKSKKAEFQKLDNNKIAYQKNDWTFEQKGKFGKLIQTSDLEFVIVLDTTKKLYYKDEFIYSFILSKVSELKEDLLEDIEFNIIQRDATVVEITMKSPCIQKGEDIINELMDVYAQQNLDRKNHIADITIEYIEKQLNKISDSLSQTENNLQAFRSSHQLLNIAEQATGISAQYRDLQNQMAELVTRKRYYDYVANYLSNKEDFSEMIVPASMGIQDPLLSNLMSELITAQSQRTTLIQNQQERNPMVQKLGIQIENIKKTITENIAAVRKTTELSIDEMNKRIRKVEDEISLLPKTQQQLGNIERRYRLNDAIYNYLLEKRAEAKITQASNLPDMIIIEPAEMNDDGPVVPNKKMNYLIAIVLGVTVPFGFFIVKSITNNKIESQENIVHLTEAPVLGKIMHNHKKSNNVMYEFPKSSLAEAYRLLRINLEYFFRGIPHKIIMVTSCTEGDGKSFNALNIAMSYAQLNQKTVLVDFDLRKPTSYFAKEEGSLAGLSSYYTDRINLEEIIFHSPHRKMDYIPSGPIPPSPVELIALGKTKELFDKLKESYDCIVLDTTPLAQVGDAYLLMEYTDLNIIIARYNHTMKKVFGLIMNDLKQKSINNVCVVLNDNRIFHEQYGYGYGSDKQYGKKRG